MSNIKCVTVTDIDSLKRNLRGIDTYASRQLGRAASSVIDQGGSKMRQLVPVDKGTLLGAVEDELIQVEPGTYLGVVGVNSAIAPHAAMVDKGTGIDGPFHRSVAVKHKRAMMFQGRRPEDKGGKVFRTEVKINPSSKIEHGKNFSGRTASYMVERTRIAVAELRVKLAAHISR